MCRQSSAENRVKPKIIIVQTLSHFYTRQIFFQGMTWIKIAVIEYTKCVLKHRDLQIFGHKLNKYQ